MTQHDRPPETRAEASFEPLFAIEASITVSLLEAKLLHLMKPTLPERGAAMYHEGLAHNSRVRKRALG